jgi:hydrogenase maturation factor HypF (carbamoyltransferase family)
MRAMEVVINTLKREIIWAENYLKEHFNLPNMDKMVKKQQIEKFKQAIKTLSEPTVKTDTSEKATDIIPDVINCPNCNKTDIRNSLFNPKLKYCQDCGTVFEVNLSTRKSTKVVL